mgnify:FL=1
MRKGKYFAKKLVVVYFDAEHLHIATNSPLMVIVFTLVNANVFTNVYPIKKACLSRLL